MGWNALSVLPPSRSFLDDGLQISSSKGTMSFLQTKSCNTKHGACCLAVAGFPFKPWVRGGFLLCEGGTRRQIPAPCHALERSDPKFHMVECTQVSGGSKGHLHHGRAVPEAAFGPGADRFCSKPPLQKGHPHKDPLPISPTGYPVGDTPELHIYIYIYRRRWYGMAQIGL